ncbi:MAG: hypothetical protein KKA07_01615 [Bacteroidetes bacterium]|nr:hypothetical protein [Bacteroidota bacterium]MBU1717747.1 hypothetical protein [Bacteroidota bacterium]
MDENRIISQPEHWHDRYSFFQTLGSSQDCIVFLGDSLTEWFDYSMLPDPRILNYGISGDTTEGVVLRAEQIIPLKPAGLFLMIGINDLLKGFDIAEIKENYRQIVQIFATHLPLANFSVYSILPTSDMEINAKVAEMNAFISQLAAEMGIEYLDLHSRFIQRRAILPELTNDGVHLTRAGYEIWTNFVKDYLK